MGTLKTGKWESYYENGAIYAVEHYDNGKRNGYYKSDYSGDLCMEGTFKNDKKTGVWKSFFKTNNQLKYLKLYDILGLATGVWESYYDSGELNNVEQHLNGKKQGKQTEYFKNGNVSKTGMHIQGQANGVWMYYYDDGHLACEKTFVNGVESGVYTSYHKNGKRHKTGMKQQFKKTGTWITYDNKGTIIKTETY